MGGGAGRNFGTPLVAHLKVRKAPRLTGIHHREGLCHDRHGQMNTMFRPHPKPVTGPEPQARRGIEAGPRHANNGRGATQADSGVAFNVVLVLAGLVVLAKGADVFVFGAARLAVALRVSPVVVGAVVVGFGTGAPELLVSSLAAMRGELDLAAGNVVGSNLANLTLVLGVAGVIAQPKIVARVIRCEAPLSLATVALFALLLQGGLTRREGVVLVVALVASVAVMLRAAQPPEDDVVRRADRQLVEEVEQLVTAAGEEDEADADGGLARRDVLRVVVGLVATVAGAQLLVSGAQRIASDVGLSGGFVGLTLVAIGTSLPELVTAIQSARRGETALLAGNVLGSSVFNSTAVAGTAALIGPAQISDRGLTVVAATAMVGVAALAWLFLGLGGRLRRWEAVVLLGVYGTSLLLVR